MGLAWDRLAWGRLLWDRLAWDRPAGVPAAATALPAMPDRPLAVAALVTWLFTVSIGVFMLTRWIRHGGLRRKAPGAGPHRPGLPPAVIFSHMGLAVTGLLLWAGFVISGSDAVGWLAAALLFPAIGLGICTVTLWTPYPAYPPTAARGPASGPASGLASGPASGQASGPARGLLAGPAENALASRLTDDMLLRALTDEAVARRLTEEVLASIPPGPPERGRKPRGHTAPLIPVAHGMGAVATFLLAILAAIGGR